MNPRDADHPATAPTPGRRRHRPASVFVAAALACAYAGPSQSAARGDDAKAGATGAYRAVDRLNAGLSPLDDPPDLETPQSSLENFMLSARRKDFDRAARSLNLNAEKPSLQPTLGTELARQLKEVIDQQLWFNWEDVPDRPDGQDDGRAIFRGDGGEARGPRSNLEIGSLFVGDLDVEIRLERVKPGDAPPVWVFSRQTVEHVPLLYEHYRSNTLENRVPAALKSTKVGRVALWQWIGLAVTLIAGGVLGWVVQKALNVALKLTTLAYARATAEALKGPGALTIGLVISHYLTRKFLGLAGPVLSVLEPVYASVLAFGVVWFAQRLINMISARVCKRYEEFNNDAANALLTRVTVARHLLTVLVLVLGTLYAMSRFEWFREMGTTILASAGVAGLIVGIAAQRMLGNLFAGFLLALTQPVKTGDAILFEGDFGWVEEVAVTYLVIRSWDLRRIVVPTTYFLDKPFQNWSRRSQQLMMPVYFYADYKVDVEAVRLEFKAAMEDCGDWDKAVPPILQVTGCREETLELRGLCSASSPAASWNLQCFVRERVANFLRTHEGGRYLPRKRVAMVDDVATPPPAREPEPDAEPESLRNGPPPGPKPEAEPAKA